MLRVTRSLAVLGLLALLVPLAMAQDRLQSWPISQKQKTDATGVSDLVKMGRAQVKWVDDSHLGYKDGNDWYLVDLPSGKKTKLDKEPEAANSTARTNPNSGRRRPGRGGQFTESLSADGKVKALYKDANVYVQVNGGETKPVTTDGDLSKRIKYGTGSWVYGEELNQNEALGVSPDGKKIWYYRFDETKVIDNMVIFRQVTPTPVFEPEAYPKPGNDNPQVDLFVYDVATGKSVTVAVRPGPFDMGMGHYVYDVHWSPAGDELFFRRTDRRQKTMEFCAANPTNGAVRVVVKEEWPKSYAENKLGVWYFDTMEIEGANPQYKGKMLWENQRNGFVNLSLVTLKTGDVQPVTNNEFDETRVVRVDPVNGRVYYMGRGMDNPYNDQLYVVGLDGKGNRRVTDPKFAHSVNLSPDGKYLVDTEQTCQDPPQTLLLDLNGKVIQTLAKSDVTEFLKAGYSLPERIVYTSADGHTKINGVLYKPRNFDPTKKYPLIVDVYGGPLDAHNSGFSENFRAYDQDTGFGVLKASFDNRGTGGRGKVFSDPLYMHMGTVEMDDQAEGAKAIIAKGCVDPDKVGITGTSYGGYSSVMCLLRHPEVFKAAVACSAVTDWHNYDTIYTERFMGLPEENKKGYEEGSAMTYAKDLSGALMIYYGTADENVHPCNTLQLLSKLRQLGKWCEVQVGTDSGHSAVDDRRAWEFFFERLGIPRN